MDKKIVTGIASYGMSGKVFHGPLLSCHPGFLLKSIVERSKDEAKIKYPDVTILRSFDELLKDDEIELIIINTPDHTHTELTHKALQAGKNVVVEKPFTLHASEAEDLLNLAIRKQLTITVFHNRRWDGDFLTIEKIVKNELLGRIVEYESHFERFRNFIKQSWKEEPANGTGTLYNLGSHLIDQALFLFGMPDAVTGDVQIFRTDAKVDDFFEVILHYKAMRVTLKGSYLVRQPGPRIIIHGTHGSYLKYGNDPQEEALTNGELPIQANWGKEVPEQWGLLNTEKKGIHYIGKIETIPGNYLHFYDNLYDVIVNHKELIVKPQEAVNVINIIEAAYKSSKQQKTVIF